MNIDITILSAIIALSGVIISVLISFASARLNIRNEIAKLETSIVQNYSSKIMEERNKRYPEVYFELSQMAKRVVTHKYKIGRTKIDINTIQNFVFKLDELDSKNCVFFSILTGSASSKLRLFTYQLIYDSLQ